MNLNLTISVDDINPKPGYRLIGEQTEKWFRQLNDDFGAKFTLFIPSCYHRAYPLSEYKEWIRELNSIEWLELAAHGHYHMTNDPQRFGECEFAELNNANDINDRLILELEREWVESIGVELHELGWRNPGWLCSEMSKNYIERYFKYAAIHYEHNCGLEWKIPTFFGHDGIHQEHLEIHNNNMIMFQSHIAGKHNHNIWNQHNYDQLRLSLTHLFENYTITPKTLKECL